MMHRRIKDQVKIFARVLNKIPELRYAGDPILRQKTSKINLKEGLAAARRLESTLLKFRSITGLGRGLAAPQIGESKALFITYADDNIEIFINPKIIQKSRETNFYKEYCISVGVMTADVERSQWIILEWTDEKGIRRQEKFSGSQARLYQHEEAHLRGLLCLDEATKGGIEFINFDPSKEKIRNKKI